MNLYYTNNHRFTAIMNNCAETLVTEIVIPSQVDNFRQYSALKLMDILKRTAPHENAHYAVSGFVLRFKSEKDRVFFFLQIQTITGIKHIIYYLLFMKFSFIYFDVNRHHI